MRTRLVALALAMTLPMPVLAGDVVVRSGETLSEIAERVGVSVERLMAVNGLSDPNHIEAGQKLRLPGGATPPPRGGGGGAASGTSVTVKEGETLSEIAERHGLSVNRLMALNGITDPDQLQVGQRLKLGGSATTAASSARPAAAAAPVYRKGAREHVVRSGESLSQIADGYGLPQSRLVALNGITDPDQLQVGQRLRLQGTPPVNRPQARATPAPAAAARPATTTPATAAATPRPAAAAATPATTAAPVATATATPAATSTAAGTARPDWRTYGPLQVDWANWLPMGGSLVAPTLNSEGQSLYLAINCSARKLNATSQAGEWKTWDDPQAEFERQLVTDLCKSRG